MLTHGKSIYLHFLDRELGEAVRQEVSEHEVQVSLKLLTLLSGATMNCSASILFESPALNRSSSLKSLTNTLVETGNLIVLSNHPTLSEFIESRSQLYSHDRSRYPMYFGKKIILPNSISILPKASSATNSLARQLSTWGGDGSRSSDQVEDAKKVVMESLVRREGRAVTASLFAAATAASNQPDMAIGIIRRQISIEYTNHFMGVLNSDIYTGVPRIEFFDICSKDFPLYDYKISAALARCIGMDRYINLDWNINRSFWESIFYRDSANGELFILQEKFEIFVRTLRTLVSLDKSANNSFFRIRITQVLERLRGQLSYRELDVGSDALAVFSSRIESVMRQLSNNRDFHEANQIARENVIGKKNFDYLLVVATEVEKDSVLKKAKELDCKPAVRFGAGRAYYDIGNINGKQIALVNSSMGSGTIGGSIATAMRIIPHLNPHYIIMVGIAFGIDEKAQEIGRVLVGKQVLAYEQQRVGKTANISRGAKVETSPVLISLLQGATEVWGEAKVEFGLMLSGEKLVDNIDFREQLKAISDGEAIGGEMEGAGLAVADAENPKHWVIVKAICDWADGNKSKHKKARQALAAKNAVSFVFRALQIASDGEDR